MGIPKKALKESQLTYLTAGSPISDGSHDIFRVTFSDNGTTKSAFFKQLAPAHHYPELLAKISVATSLFKRVFQGKNSAEERLVFNDSEELIGTLSVTIDGFKPFNFADEPVPIDPSAKEQVIPSTKTLIEKNAMEILFGRWFLDDDDAHPHNLGFAGSSAADIDFDMFWYWFTIYMKEPRPVIGVPKKRVSLSVSDWESFPITKDAKHYHSPTYTYPGQETLPTVIVPAKDTLLPRVLPKAYADPEQFRLLANDPVAQEQKLAVALKVLLTYQPEVVKARLIETFGEMTLNYTSLDATSTTLRLKYESEFPLLCNERTNSKPFVDFMMGLYQEHYDNLYRIVVFYMGCENNGHGVPLAATHSALYHKPSLYQKIVAWVTEQNSSLYSKEEDSAIKYDLSELPKRYHQVWRDAFAPSFKELLQDSFLLTNKLLHNVSTFVEISPEIVGKKTTDETLTRAWELFGTMPELSKEKIALLISVDKDSKLRVGLMLLVDFTNKFYAITKTYYEKDCKALTEEDNLTFVSEIRKLDDEYNLKIRQSLENTSSFANEFNRIALSLKQFSEQANFQLHRTTTDEQMAKVRSAVIAKDLLPHTHEEVLAQFNDALFLWAKSINPAEFSRLVNDIIDTYYAPVLAPFSRRARSAPVKAYLEASIKESNENRLAYILSSGNDVGALNSSLIEYLTPHVLQTHHLPSIRNAVKSKAFKTDILVFSRSATLFAKTDSRFTHLYNAGGIALFYQTLFKWVAALDSSQFIAIVKAALTEYEKGISYWTTSRRAEVEGYCKTCSQVKALAMTFLNGGETATSLSPILFQKIVTAIKADIRRSVSKQDIPGYKLIAQYDPDTHKDFYLREIKVHSAGHSHTQEELPSAPLSGVGR